MNKIAACIRGAISKNSGTNLHINEKYINFQICANSIFQHLINANTEYQFDFFIHSWNKDLEQDLNKLYNPKISLFEDNSLYNQEISNKCKIPNDFSGVSHSLSIKKSIELLEFYDEKDYDLCILLRPDVILLKDINLNYYDRNKIYVNGTIDKSINADFRFTMNLSNLFQFKNLYHSIEKGNFCRAHFWMKNYINNYMHQPLYEDDLIAGVDEEVLRKIYFTTIQQHKVPIQKFLPYGLTLEEIKTYDKP